MGQARAAAKTRTKTKPMTGNHTMIRILICVTCVLSSGFAAAQPSHTGPYEDGFNGCLATEAPEACTGQAAAACMAAEEGGQTTLGMTRCLGMEGVLWSWAISRETTQMLHRLRAIDAGNREFHGEAYSGAAEALAVSRATWEAWAEAECALDYALWGAGSHRNVAAGQCRIALSAARLTRLRSLLDPISE